MTSAIESPEEIVRRAQRGEVDAFELLYKQEAPAVYSICRRLAESEDEARELVQDAFVRAWERLDSFRFESAIGTWLHRLAVNVSIERIRARKRDALRMIEVDPDDVRLSLDAGSADGRMDLDAALAQLPRGARTVFVLHDIQGYTHEEIAQLIGIAAGTARAQSWRARQALLRMLDR